MNVEISGESSTLLRAIPLITFLSFLFLSAVVHGILDHKRGEMKFWRRPGLVLLLWTITVAFFAIFQGLHILIDKLESYNNVLSMIAIVPVSFAYIAVLLGGCILSVGTIGCTFFIPFVKAEDVKRL